MMTSSVRVKICGLSTEATMDVALDAGADFVGLVFFPKSPRHVSIARARALAERVKGRAAVVALLVDADDAALADVIAHVSPDILQLHGKETPERVTAIRQRFGRPLMKAIAVETALDAERAFDFGEVADHILFDAKAPKDAILPGGNGLAFDWRALETVRGKIKSWMLSGGLTPDMVADAVRLTGATAVDVSSGVESAPGIKDPGRIRAFIAAAKAQAPRA